MLTSQIITFRATQIAALANEPLKRFPETNKTLTVIKGNIFEHLATEAICPTWLYEEMGRANTLICGSQTVVDNMYIVLDRDTERHLNDDFNALRIGNMLRIPIFSWSTKDKPVGDPTLFAGC